MDSTLKDEVIIKLVGKLTVEFPKINQLKLRDLIEKVLYDYDIITQEKSLITSDIEEKMHIYLAVKKLDGLSPKTLYNYNINLLIFAMCLKKPIVTITTTDIRMYLSNRCKNMKATSINAQISILKSFFSWLISEEYITKNPMTKIKQTKVPKRLRNAMTDEETELLKQACKNLREAVIIELFLSTGCRLSEIVKANKEDVDLHDMSITVIGKGNKERKAYFSTRAKILLRKYIKSRKDNSNALIVSSRKPHCRIGGRAIEKEVKKIAARAGFEKSIYPHLFRHSFATHNINAGMPLHILQALMGHESADTTMVYAEISDENVKHEYRKIS